MQSKFFSFVPRASLRAKLLLPLIVLLAAGCASTSKPVATDTPKAFWPPFPDEPRIQYLVAYESSKDIQPQKSGFDKLIYGKEAEQEQFLSKPYGVRIWNGKIYVCDIRSNCVTALDLRKHEVLVIGKSGADSLQTPSDIAIAPDGTKYVTDNGRDVIAVFDAQDKRVATFGVKGLKPVAAAVHNEELYVCDFAGQRVVVFNRRTGQVTRTIGGPGSGPEQFVRPISVAVDSQGFVYVMDVMKCQLQKFDPNGKVMASFGTVSSSVGGLVRPKHIAVDKDGIIYVVDAAFQNVQLFNQQGQPLTFFGAAGAFPGAMYLPAGICVDDQNLDLFQQYVHPAFQAERLIFVTNQFGPNKVAVYALGHLKSGKTVADISASKGLVAGSTEDTKLTKGPVPEATTLPADLTQAGPQQPVATPAKSGPPVVTPAGSTTQPSAPSAF